MRFGSYGVHGFLGPPFVIEILYSAIVVALCFYIYYKTREIYELTSHRGIKYFRRAFLFFGIAFVFRFLTNIFIFGNRILDFEIPRALIHFGRAFFVYSSSMAILYLTYSTLQKRFKTKNIDYILNFVALAIVILVILTRSHLIILISQVLLFMFAVIMSYLNQRKKKKGFFSQLYMIYVLLFLFWILNILADAFRFFHVARLPLDLISVFLFLIIMYKVISKTRIK